MGLIITERGFELFATVTWNDPAAGDFLESSASRSLPLFKKILNSHQFQFVRIFVKETFGFELTNQARRTDLGDAGCHRQFRSIANLSPRSAQELRLDVLSQDNF